MAFTFRHAQGKIRRLLAIHMPAVDVGASAAWYAEHLGLTILNLSEASAELAVIQNGSVLHPKLILTKTASNHRLNYVKNGRNRSMVMMHASNLEGLRDKMAAAGAHVTQPHADQEEDGCGRFFEARDPSGNIVQLQANDGEPPAGHTKVEAIFNLEIPVFDVRKSARFYADVLGFQLIREPDDQLAIAKTGPFYKERFGYSDVQEFGFFLFRLEERTALHFEVDAGHIQECLVMQADDITTLHEQLTSKGYTAAERIDVESGQMSLHIVDPDGNRIKVVPVEKSGLNANLGEIAGEEVMAVGSF